ncbi:MAG: YbaK/EbsC family protein [Pseudomonadota bacterium]
MDELPRAALRVAEALRAKGLEATIRQMPSSTRTAEEAAQACGCEVGQIIKSLVFQGAVSGRPYLLLVSGKNRVNEKTVGRLIGEKLKRPDAHFVRDVTGFAIGGIPPLGHDQPMAVYLDEDLLAYGTAWGAAGTPDCVVELDLAALSEAIGAQVTSVA